MPAVIARSVRRYSAAKEPVVRYCSFLTGQPNADTVISLVKKKRSPIMDERTNSGVKTVGDHSPSG